MLNLIFPDTLLLHFLVSLLSEVKDAAESRPMVYWVMESRSKKLAFLVWPCGFLDEDQLSQSEQDLSILNSFCNSTEALGGN